MSYTSLLYYLTPSTLLFILALLSLITRRVNSLLSATLGGILTAIYLFIYPHLVASYHLQESRYYDFLILDIFYPHVYSTPFSLIMIVALLVGNISLLSIINKKKSLLVIFASHCYVASSLGMIFSNNAILSLIYLELMAVFAIIIISLSIKNHHMKSVMRYITFHFTAGAFILAGLVSIYMIDGKFSILYISSYFHGQTGINTTDLNIVYIFQRYLILLGLLINTGIPILSFSSWLLDCYSKVQWQSAIILSSVTTKTVIFLIYILYSGEVFLVHLGIVTCIFAVTKSLVENHFRYYINYALILQIGFMLIAIGTASHLALILLIIGDILYKIILLVSTGIIFNKSKINNLSYFLKFPKGHGYTRIMLWGCVLYSILSITATPFTPAFVGKFMLKDSLELHSNFYYSILQIISYATIYVSVGKLIACTLQSYQNNNETPSSYALNINYAYAALIINFLIIICFEIAITQYQSIYYIVAEHALSQTSNILFMIPISVISIPIFNYFQKSHNRTNDFYEKYIFYFIRIIDIYISFICSAIKQALLILLSLVFDFLLTTYKSNKDHYQMLKGKVSLGINISIIILIFNALLLTKYLLIL